MLRCLLILFAVSAACAPQLTSGEKKKKKANGGGIETISESGGEVQMDSGALVAIPAGAVAAGSEVVFQPSTAPAEFSALSDIRAAADPVSLSGTDNNGAPLVLSASPMTINIPLTGLALVADYSELCALLKGVDGKLFAWRRRALTIDESANAVKLQTLYFGTYQLVHCGTKPLPNFLDASDQGASGETQVTVRLQVPSVTNTVRGAFQCLFLIEEKSDDSHPVLGVTRAAAAQQALSISFGSSKVGDDGIYFVGLGFTDKVENCDLVVGEDLDKRAGFTLNGFFGFKVEPSDLRDGIDAQFGAGDFRLVSIPVQIGPAGFNGQTTTRTDDSCFEIEWADKSGITVANVLIGAAGTIDGLANYSIEVPEGSGALRLQATVGAGCFGTVTPDNKTGRPYSVELVNQGEIAFNLIPVKIRLKDEIKQLAQVASAQSACFDVKPTFGGEKSGVSRYIAGFATAEYDVLLPFSTTPDTFSFDGSGQPMYDYSITLVAGDCKARKAVDLSVFGSTNPRTAPNKGLTATIQLPE
jgi:hypothetical protein